MVYEFIVPARNEERLVGALVGSIRDALGVRARIIVVENGSTDGTGRVAASAGADVVVHESTRGKGYAVVAGARAATNDRVFVCDADIEGMDWQIALGMVDRECTNRPSLVRAHIDRDPASAPVTTLLAVPMMRALGHRDVQEPLGGVFAVERSLLLDQHLPGGWGFDIGLTLLVLGLGASLEEVPVQGVTHRTRLLSDYPEMAGDVAETIAVFAGLRSWDHDDCTLCTRER